MPDIVLATLNARYPHASFGLRYLFANLQELQEQAKLLEFVISDQIPYVLAQILAESPKIIGLGVYIWNVEPTTRLVADLKRLRPEIRVVLGGPEVSYESESMEIAQLADHVVCGEGDLAFPVLCRQLLDGSTVPDKWIRPPVPTMEQLVLPYDFYTDEDLAHRVIYVEASRGCPFACEFCLSSLEIPVRAVPVESFLAAMQGLLDRGAMHFKFVDRTFNLNLRMSQAILQFFLDRYRPGMFYHFEMIPDRLPEAIRSLIAKFPPGTIQLEIGIQTLNPQVEALISRRQDHARLDENFRFLRQETGVHLHADLIVGLPGEDLESFAAGFDRLYRLQPQEIQIGILKRLRGTPIVRHDEAWGMRYSQHPPYEILETRCMDFDTIHRLRRIARHWDLIGNSGNFVETLEWIIPEDVSPFQSFAGLSDWLCQHEPRMHGIALAELYAKIFLYLSHQRDGEVPVVQSLAQAMWRDYQRGGRRDRPVFLQGFDLPAPPPRRQRDLPNRQVRHLQKDS